MRVFVILTTLALWGSAQGMKDPKVDPARMQIIWEAFDDRVSTQTDVWFEDGEFPRVIQLLRVMTALYPSNYDTVTNLGWMLENVEKWDEALAVYVNFRKHNANHPEGYYPEANFYYSRKLYSKVPPLIEPSLKMKIKPHPNSYRILAMSYERMGLLSDARRVFKMIIDRDPSDATAKMNLSRVEKKIQGQDRSKRKPATISVG